VAFLLNLAWASVALVAVVFIFAHSARTGTGGVSKGLNTKFAQDKDETG
jgi:hypothetical protein